MIKYIYSSRITTFGKVIPDQAVCVLHKVIGKIGSTVNEFSCVVINHELLILNNILDFEGSGELKIYIRPKSKPASSGVSENDAITLSVYLKYGVTYTVVFPKCNLVSTIADDPRSVTPSIPGAKTKMDLFRWVNDREGHRGAINYSTIFNDIKICHT